MQNDFLTRLELTEKHFPDEVEGKNLIHAKIFGIGESSSRRLVEDFSKSLLDISIFVGRIKRIKVFIFKLSLG